MCLRILDVSPRAVWPPEGGGEMRTFQLMRHLSRNHFVRQFSQTRWQKLWRPSFPEKVWITPRYCEFRWKNPLTALASELCQRSWIGTPLLSGAGLDLFRPSQLRAWLQWADVTLVEFPWQFAFCRRQRPGGRLILAAHNLELLKSADHARAAGVAFERNPWHRYTLWLEREAVRTADLVLAVSGQDRRGFIDHYRADPRRVVEIPNGADTERLEPVDGERRAALRRQLGLPDRPTVIYLAANAKSAHLAGLQWVERTAARMPDFNFLVVGGVLGRPQRRANLIGTGLVDDPAAYLQASDLSLCPIEFGGGTKIKVLESLAVGLPLVAFRETVAGTALKDGVHLVISPKTDQALQLGLRRLAADRELAGRLGAAGRRHVVAHHDWRDIAGRLEQALLELTARDSAQPGAGRGSVSTRWSSVGQ